MYLRQYPEYVTFTTPHKVKLGPISGLPCHSRGLCAGCSYVRSDQYINKLHRDIEDGTKPNPNGASAEMLEYALIRLQA